MGGSGETITGAVTAGSRSDDDDGATGLIGGVGTGGGGIVGGGAGNNISGNLEELDWLFKSEVDFRDSLLNLSHPAEETIRFSKR